DDLVTREMRQHLPLRARQVEAGRPLVEALAHQPRDVVQQEAEGRIELMSGHDRNIISKLVISKGGYPRNPQIDGTAPLIAAEALVRAKREPSPVRVSLIARCLG